MAWLAHHLNCGGSPQTVRNCPIKESEGGVLVNADTQAPLSYQDPCVELNPHVGGNPETAEQARKAVSDFLAALFKLGRTAILTPLYPAVIARLDRAIQYSKER